MFKSIINTWVPLCATVHWRLAPPSRLSAVTQHLTSLTQILTRKYGLCWVFAFKQQCWLYDTTNNVSIHAEILDEHTGQKVYQWSHFVFLFSAQESCAASSDILMVPVSNDPSKYRSNKWYLWLYNVHSALWPRLSVNIFRWIVRKTHFPSDNLKLNLSAANYVEELDFNDTVSMSAGLSMSRPFYKSIDA